MAWEYEKSVAAYLAEAKIKDRLYDVEFNITRDKVERIDANSEYDREIGKYEIHMPNASYLFDRSTYEIKNAFTLAFIKSENDPLLVGLKEATTAIDMQSSLIAEYTNAITAQKPASKYYESYGDHDEKAHDEHRKQAIKSLQSVVEKAGEYIDRACSNSARWDLGPTERRDLDRLIETYVKTLKNTKSVIREDPKYSYKSGIEKITDKVANLVGSTDPITAAKTAIETAIDKQQKQIERNIGLER
jgi:hypothetical protein